MAKPTTQIDRRARRLSFVDSLALYLTRQLSARRQHDSSVSTYSIQSEPRVPDDHTVVKDPEAVDDLKTAANLEALGGEAKHKFHGVKAKHKFRGTRRGGKAQVSWREGETQVSWDLETKGRGRPRGRKWSRGPGRPRGGAADLEALGVKAKHKFHGENAKHKFRGCEEPKQDQVGRGNKRTKARQSGTWSQKVEDDLEAASDHEAADDSEVVDNPGTVGGYALGLNPQSRSDSSPPWRPCASPTRYSNTGNPRQRK
nr:hypothetical protein Iba_chr13bCG13320 [Ipomoea batatas]